MLLAVDCGNTNTEFGIFEKSKLVSKARFTTREMSTVDSCALCLDWFLNTNSIPKKELDTIVIGSVVPRQLPLLSDMCRKFYNVEPLIVTPLSPLGIKIHYEDPREVGTDRVVGSLAALKKYGGPCIIVDFGTATTFDVITKDGDYLGGAICPGINSSASVLSRDAAQLFGVKIEPPGNLIGKTTEDSIKSGLFYGAVALVEGFVTKISEQMQTKFTVVATGGLSDIVSGHTEAIDKVDKSLVLDGLAFAYEIITNQMQ